MRAIPAEVLPRFVALAQQLAAHKSWWDSASVVRYAALPLVLAEGAPAVIAPRVAAASRTLAEHAGWLSELRGPLRYVIAGWLAASEHEPTRFSAACEAIRGRFREAQLRRGGAYEVVAATMLHVADAGDAAHVHRVQQIYAAMKQHHWWLTGPDDLPACALLAVQGGELAALERRIEGSYRRLHAAGLPAGSGLQMASHLLALVPGPEAAASARFLALHSGFRAAGVRMWDGDLDELALLCLTPQDVAHVVRTVLAHRAEIKAGVRVASPTASFSLACGTAWLDAHAGQTLDERLWREVQIATLAMAANAAHIRETEKRAAAGS